MTEGLVEIPPERLELETLEALVESFVNREGTDYGAVERSLDSKVNEVLGQVRRGRVVICFDPRTESCNLLAREDFERLQRQYYEGALHPDERPYQEELP